MESAFWDRVVAEGHRVPSERSLADLTAELTAMLGDPDPHRRDSIAFEVLATWISEGVYDELLEGLGDGMTAGLMVGIGEVGTDTVFRRSFSALVLAQCVSRDNEQHILAPETLLGWGDRTAGWLVRERDLRGFVPGKGWAHAVSHGADVLGVLAQSEAMGRLELTVLLDVVADRLLTESDQRLIHGEEDRLAAATMAILRRDLVGPEVLEPWLARLAASARPDFHGRGRPLPRGGQRAAVPARALPPARVRAEPSGAPGGPAAHPDRPAPGVEPALPDLT